MVLAEAEAQVATGYGESRTKLTWQMKQYVWEYELVENFFLGFTY